MNFKVISFLRRKARLEENGIQHTSNDQSIVIEVDGSENPTDDNRLRTVSKRVLQPRKI